MAIKLVSIQEFHKLVRDMVKEAIREEMVTELDRLNLKELGTAPPPVPAAQPNSGTKPGTSPGGPAMKVGDNVQVPGSNMNLNQFLAAASKETNFEKKKQMIAQASQILTTLNALEEGNKGDREDKVGPRDDQYGWNAHGMRLAKKEEEKKEKKEMADAKKRLKETALRAIEILKASTK